MVKRKSPGSELAKAKEFGFDLTLFVSSPRRTPTERAPCLSEGACIFLIARQQQLIEK
jgi:hypothetical protein